MRNISFGKEQDCPIPQKKGEDINDENDLDLDDVDEELEKVNYNNNKVSNQDEEIELINNKIVIYNSIGDEEDNPYKTSHENEEEIKKSKNNIKEKESIKDNKSNDSVEEDEKKEEKKEKDVKPEEKEEKEEKKEIEEKEEKEEKGEEEEEKEEKEDEKKKRNKLRRKKKNDLDSDKFMKEKEKLLIQSIHNKENVTKEKINLANEINFKSVPQSIIITNEYGFLIENEENNKDINSKKESNKDQSNRALELLKINARMEKWDLMIKHYDDFYKNKFSKLKSRTRKGVPDCFRSKVWQIFAEKKKFYVIGKFNSLDSVQLNENLELTIIKDLDRTFPKCYFFKEKYGNGQRKLYRVLSNYSKYNSEIGYVQGMGFIAALFLTYMDEESSFFMLDSLIKKYELEGFFLPNFPELKRAFYIYLNLLKKFIPKVYELLKKEGVIPSMYATEWFICIFSRNLEFNVLVRVFDVFFLEGYKIVYRISLAIIKINEKKFFEKNEGITYIMEVFKTICDGIDPDLLLQIAFGFSFSRKDINALKNQYETVKSNQNNEFVQQL